MTTRMNGQARRALASMAMLPFLTACESIPLPNPVFVVAQVQQKFHTVESPEDGPVARLRLVSEEGVILHPESDCVDRGSSRAGAALMPEGGAITAGHTGQRLGMPGAAPAGYDVAELRVRAGRPFTVIYESASRRGDFIHVCRLQLSALPEAGRDYQLVLGQINRRDARDGCGAVFVDLARPEQPLPLTKAPYCRGG